MSLMLGALAGAGEGAQQAGAQMQKDLDQADSDQRRSDLELNRQTMIEQLKHGQELGLRNSAIGLGAGASPQETEARIAELARTHGVSPDVVRADFYAGKGTGISGHLAEADKPDTVISDGYLVNKKTGEHRALPGVHVTANGQAVGVMPDANGNPTVSLPQGAPQAYGTYQGIEAGIKSANTPYEVLDPVTGRKQVLPLNRVLGAPSPDQLTALPQPTGPAITGGASLNTEADMRKAAQGDFGPKPGAYQRQIDQMRLDMQRPSTTPEQRQMLQEQIQEYQRQRDKYGDNGGQSAPTTPAQAPVTVAQGAPYSTDFSPQEKASHEAVPLLNKDFIEKEYRPAIDAGKSANEMMESVRATRQVMEKMGNTGWGKEAWGNASSVLEGLGISNLKARSAAEHQQEFQSLAMTQLQKSLVLQNGVQTEGDATRAAQTFAKLGNTTQANRYILDMAEANAARTVMRAKFYQEMIPTVKSTGDYTEIARQWQQIQPSIFSMPTMRPWNQQ
jgi:hypothetical protein